MKLSEQILCAIDDAEAGKFNAALLHACISIDTNRYYIEASLSLRKESWRSLCELHSKILLAS
jgi:hypothetical protein